MLVHRSAVQSHFTAGTITPNTCHFPSATNAWSLALLRAWMNLGTSGRGFSGTCGVSKLDLPQNNYIWKMYPPSPTLCISPLSHAQGLPSSILSNPVLSQKLSLLWVLGRVLWQGFLVQQRSTTNVPLSNLPTSCRYSFPTPGQALGICRHTEFCKTDRTTWKLTYYARRQHETERTKNRGFWFFRCRVDVLHS